MEARNYKHFVALAGGFIFVAETYDNETGQLTGCANVRRWTTGGLSVTEGAKSTGAHLDPVADIKCNPAQIRFTTELPEQWLEL